MKWEKPVMAAFGGGVGPCHCPEPEPFEPECPKPLYDMDCIDVGVYNF